MNFRRWFSSVITLAICNGPILGIASNADRDHAVRSYHSYSLPVQYALYAITLYGGARSASRGIKNRTLEAQMWAIPQFTQRETRIIEEALAQRRRSHEYLVHLPRVQKLIPKRNFLAVPANHKRAPQQRITDVEQLNNFYAHFLDDNEWSVLLYRLHEPYLRYRFLYPDREAELTRKVTEVIRRKTMSDPYQVLAHELLTAHHDMSQLVHIEDLYTIRKEGTIDTWKLCR